MSSSPLSTGNTKHLYSHSAISQFYSTSISILTKSKPKKKKKKTRPKKEMSFSRTKVRQIASTLDDAARRQLMVSLHELAYSLEDSNDTIHRYGYLVCVYFPVFFFHYIYFIRV